MMMVNDEKIVQDTGMEDDGEANDDEMNMEAEEVLGETPENMEELVELTAKRKETGDDLKERLKSKLEAAKQKKYVEEEKMRLSKAYMEVVKKNEAEGRKKNEADRKSVV